MFARRSPRARGHRDALVAQQQGPMFRVTRDTVPVFVTVVDKDNRLVAGLTREDFQVLDGGKPQPLTLFDNTPQPVRLIVMLDVSGSMIGNLPLLRAACEQLFSRLGPNDARASARSATRSRSARVHARSAPVAWRRCRRKSSPTRRRRSGGPSTPRWLSSPASMSGACARAERRQGQRPAQVLEKFIGQLDIVERGAPRRSDAVRHRPAQPRPAAADGPGDGPAAR